MRLAIILLIAFLMSSFDIFGQTRNVSGKIINENLEAIPEVRIRNSDSVLLATTDINGKFEIVIPTTTKILLFDWVGYERKSINLTTNCDTLEIILMYNMTYDFISPTKVDKLRIKRFEKLPELYSAAFKRGIFNSQQPCYAQNFEHVGKK
jgi:hypothetical protein